MRVLLSLLVLLSVLSAFSLSVAAAYPDKEIQVLIGFKPGGGSDVLAMSVQPFLEKVLRATFTNVYKPGATGAIAWSLLAHTKPDGYTISITNTPMLLTNYRLLSGVSYNVKDLAPIANIVTDPGILVVAGNSPFKTFQDFIKAAKEKPGTLTIGNSGIGGDDYFNVILLQKATGIKVINVPFEGDGPSWQAAMGGHISATSNNLGIVYPQIKAGKLRALAIYAEKRYAGLPDVPTLKELGINLVSGSSRGYSAPKGTSPEILKILADGMEKVVNDPVFLKNMEERALPIDFKKLDEYRDYLFAEDERYEKLIEELRASGDLKM